MTTMSQLRYAIGVCVLITSAAIPASAEEVIPQEDAAGNIQVDCLIEMSQGTGRTNRNISICIREGSEFTAQDVTEVSFVSETGSVEYIEAGIVLTASARSLHGDDGIVVTARLEAKDGVAGKVGGLPISSRWYIEFESEHKSRGFVRVWSTDFPAGQAGRPVAVHVRAFEAADVQEPVTQAEEPPTTTGSPVQTARTRFE